VKAEHVHSYRRIRGRPNFFMCTDPKCTHTNSKDLLLGKQALCTKCGEVFILQTQDLRYHIPVCIYCHDSPQAKKRRFLKDKIAEFASSGDAFKPIVLDEIVKEGASTRDLNIVLDQVEKLLEVAELNEEEKVVRERIEL